MKVTSSFHVVIIIAACLFQATLASKLRRRLEVKGNVTRAGNDGYPSSAFPLQKCQSDCDYDEDCDEGLFCFFRSANEDVPGCSGLTDAFYDDDFCVDPVDAPPSLLVRVGNGEDFGMEYPLAKCRGDCDDDSDCMGVLKCLHRIDGFPDTVPGCYGHTAYTDTDYCYDPNDGGILSYIGDEGEPPENFPLDHCQGDCDSDLDCIGNFRCFFRDLEPTVPGCSGVAEDYVDYCYNPKDYVELSTKGDNWDPIEAFPLKLCEGDCDGDSDCEGELVCHQRDEGDPVPSCFGQPDSNYDYCIHPSDETAKPPESGSFRIKMFWAEGFIWQEESWEQEWCIICGSGGGLDCNVDDQIFISVCDDDVTWFFFENLNNEETQIRVANTNLCFELDGQRDIRLRECNSTLSRQKFGPGNGSFIGDKFEIFTDVNPGCLSQQHHPRESERVFRNDCGIARQYDTSFWLKY